MEDISLKKREIEAKLEDVRDLNLCVVDYIVFENCQSKSS